jgi:hypothetical protein
MARHFALGEWGPNLESPGIGPAHFALGLDSPAR